jgi:hypothetical protein
MPTNPRTKELVDEIVRLSTEFGILTEYTAFLALEGTDLSTRENIVAEANKQLFERAVATRTGVGGVNQSLNYAYQSGQKCLNVKNGYWDANMKRVEINSVQQVCDRAMYRRNGQWVDAEVLNKGKTVVPDKTIEFDTAEFYTLVERLVGEGRQALLAAGGDTVLSLDGRTVLVKAPAK